jgi:cardiolipin synthase
MGVRTPKGIDISEPFRFIPNIPNVLTVIRFFMVPVFLLLYLLGMEFYALFVFVLAEATDVLDGYIARKMELVTPFGKLMDPLADKVMTLTVTLVLCLNQRLPIYWLIVLLAKEAAMIGGSLLLYRKRRRVVYSNLLGKFAAVLVFLVLVCAFFTSILPPWLFISLQVLALLISVMAVVLYGYVHFIRVNKESVQQ